MRLQLLHSTKHRSWISLASVVTSQQLRHMQLRAHVRRKRRVWIALRVPRRVCGGTCVRACHTVHAHWMSRSPCSLNESWPSSRNTDWKNVRVCPRLLSVCAANGSVTRRRFWAVEKRGCDWLPLKSCDTWDKNNRPMLSSPRARKMNYRRYWRCFAMPNCQLPKKNTYWCINPARCSECHFTTQWVRTSF